MSDTTNPIRDEIAKAISEHEVILFMKGRPEQPMCGFSARTVAALDSLGASYAAVDILPDPRIRQELSRDLELADDPAAVRQGRAGRRLRHRHRDVRDRRAGRDARRRAAGRRAGGGAGRDRAGRPAPPDPQRPRLELLVVAAALSVAAGDGNEQPAHRTAPPPLATAARITRPTFARPAPAPSPSPSRPRTAASAATTLAAQSARRACARRCCWSPCCAAPPRARSPPTRRGLLEPDDHGVRQRRRAQALRDDRRRRPAAPSASAARMTHLGLVGARLRDPHHRRRPGALLPADRPPRPQAPPRLRPRAAGRHHRPAAVGDRAGRAIPPLRRSSSRAGGARASSTRPRYWSGAAAGSRSRSSPRANRPSPTGEATLAGIAARALRADFRSRRPARRRRSAARASSCERTSSTNAIDAITTPIAAIANHVRYGYSPHPHLEPLRVVALQPPPQHELRDADQQVDEQRHRAGRVEQEQEHLVGRDHVRDHRQEADRRRDQDRPRRHAAAVEPHHPLRRVAARASAKFIREAT